MLVHHPRGLCRVIIILCAEFLFAERFRHKYEQGDDKRHACHSIVLHCAQPEVHDEVGEERGEVVQFELTTFN